MAVHPMAVTDGDFAEAIEQHEGLAIVDFWATWCGPCQAIKPIIEKLAEDYEGKVKVAKMDVDTNQMTPMRFGVRSIPSVLFFKNGQHVDTVVGAGYPTEYFVQKLEQHLG